MANAVAKANAEAQNYIQPPFQVVNHWRNSVMMRSKLLKHVLELRILVQASRLNLKMQKWRPQW